MKKIFMPALAALLLLLSPDAKAQGEVQDAGGTKYRVSVLTCAPGGELYAAFGHTAIRIVSYDDSQPGDVIYNFGLFDFSTPNFYLKFIRGDLDYFVGIQRPEIFVYEYLSEGRGVVEQVLDVTQDQAEAIVAELAYRMLPENRAYRYKFTGRNCTTEVRYIVMDVLDMSGYDPGAPSGYTYRNHLDECLASQPWVKLGVDLMLGSPADKQMDLYESMFLPDKLMRQFDLMDNNGGPLVSESRTLGDQEYRYDAGVTAWKKVYPLLIFFALLAFALLGKPRVTSFVVFLLTGIVGLVLCGALIITEHAELQANFNMLWCHPLWLACAWAAMAGKRKAMLVLSLVCAAGIFGTMVVGLAGIQCFAAELWVWQTVLLVLLWRNNRRLGGKDVKGWFGK